MPNKAIFVSNAMRSTKKIMRSRAYFYDLNSNTLLPYALYQNSSARNNNIMRARVTAKRRMNEPDYQYYIKMAVNTNQAVEVDNKEYQKKIEQEFNLHPERFIKETPPVFDESIANPPTNPLFGTFFTNGSAPAFGFPYTFSMQFALQEGPLARTHAGLQTIQAQQTPFDQLPPPDFIQSSPRTQAQPNSNAINIPPPQLPQATTAPPMPTIALHEYEFGALPDDSMFST